LTFYGHVTSSVMWPFDTPYAISYECSIVTESVSPVVFEIMGPTYWGHDLDLSNSSYVIGHVTIDSSYAISYRLSIWTESLSPTIFEIFGPHNVNERTNQATNKPSKVLVGRIVIAAAAGVVIIRPLSGTSSFVKCHSAVHGFFCLQWRLHLCQWVNSTCLSVPTSWIPWVTWKPKETYTYLYGYCVYNQLKNKKNHRCQCKQMHGNYFRITTAQCHLTAV